MAHRTGPKPTFHALIFTALGTIAIGMAACSDSPTAPKTPQAPPPTATPTPVPVGSLTLSGTIYDWEGGAVGSTGVVRLESGAQQGTVVYTNGDGSYRFDHLSPGSTTVLAQARYHASATKTISLTSDSSLDFTLSGP